MGLALEPAQAEAFRDGRREMVPLRVEAAGHRLDVREPCPVLDVQDGAAVQVPGDDVGPARELVVLVRLVDPDGVPKSVQVGNLQLAHRGMDQVGVVPSIRPLSRIDDLDPDLHAECPCSAHGHLQ